MQKKILITGATGLIGKNIVNELINQGAFVRILTTDPENAAKVFKHHYAIQILDLSDYNDPLVLCTIIDDTNVIINLAGANAAGKRWSREYKRVLYDSRIDMTKLIVESIRHTKKKPDCLISSSAVGYYGFRGDEIVTEDSNGGNDFLAKLCTDWELEALNAVQFNVRVVTMRTGIVLDKNEGALKEFLTPFKFHVGVYQGNGKQWFSWIHIDDITRLYIAAIEDTTMFGAINGTSPNPVTNKELTTTIGKVLNRNLIMPVPGFILKIAVGEFAENLLTGQRVIPEKALQKGFTFNYPDIKDALTNLLKNKKADVN